MLDSKLTGQKLIDHLNMLYNKQLEINAQLRQMIINRVLMLASPILKKNATVWKAKPENNKHSMLRQIAQDIICSEFKVYASGIPECLLDDLAEQLCDEIDY